MNEALPLVAPQNIEAEQALLGAIFLNNEAYHRVSWFLRPEHFLEPIHTQIFETCGKIIGGGKSANPITLKTYLADDLTEDLTTKQYLARLAAEATTVLNALDFAKVIYDNSVRRDLINMAEEIKAEAYTPDPDRSPNDIIEEAEKHLFALAETGNEGRGVKSFSEALHNAIETASAAYKRDGTLSGIPTGLADLDSLMGGLQDSDLVILAARPSMGKTAMATNIAYSVASNYSGQKNTDGTVSTINGGQVLFFSLEMSDEQLATRILSDQANVPSSLIRRGNIHENQFNSLMDKSRLIAGIPLHIDDRGGLNIAQVVARARRTKRQVGVDLIVIDYIQLLSGTTQKSQTNRVQEITEITTKLKALAKELDVPILALSQLSRQVESRDDKRPQLADLRESGSIEQDADVVMFIYREEYYLKGREPKEGSANHLEWQADMEAAHGKAEIIIAKQRHGATGIIQVQFNAGLTKFSNLAKQEYMPERMA